MWVAATYSALRLPSGIASDPRAEPEALPALEARVMGVPGE
jgi:hypothetical protein